MGYFIDRSYRSGNLYLTLATNSYYNIEIRLTNLPGHRRNILDYNCPSHSLSPLEIGPIVNCCEETLQHKKALPYIKAALKELANV